MFLDDRSRRILFAVVQSYINNPGPVGSRFIKKRYSFDFSPATIRNVMADLEEMGLLYQPHTSAGRVPTDTAYRFYVDTLAEHFDAFDIHDELSHELDFKLESLRRDVNTFLDNASRMLSDFTNYIGITMSPNASTTTLRRIELLPYRQGELAVILFTGEGIIQHKIIALEKDFSPQELLRIADHINLRFSGQSFEEIRKIIVGEITSEKLLCDLLISETSRVCSEIFSSTPGNIFISGLSGLLKLPDFSDMERIRRLLRTLEDKSVIVKLLDQIADTEGAQVFIGSENPLAEMDQFSLIAAPYREGDRPIGAVGIIGPTRMNYRQAIAIVNTTARYITRLLSQRE